jgi:hypothetical protein
MKKFTFLLVIFFLIFSFCLYAQEESFDDEQFGIGGGSEDFFGNDPLDIAGSRKTFGFKDRSLEIGLAHVNTTFANNFLSIKEVFQDVVVIDLDKLADGFMLNLGLGVTPFYFTYKTKKGWGFGLSTDVEGTGILGLSGNMLTLSEAVKENSDIGGALFASTTINAFFNVQKFKVKVNPSLFYSLFYITSSPKSSSGLEYTLDYTNGTVLCVDYDIRIYSGIPLDGESSELTSKPGLDFTIGVEYPLAKEIGLSNKVPFLDFDVSLNFINVPFIPSQMTDYTQIKGRIGSDKPITFFGDDGFDFSSFNSTDESETGNHEIGVNRPFKMLVSADWRPLPGGKLLTVTPVIGFCHNALYYDPVSLEIGINAGLNMANFFLVKAGLNYTDRMFVNSLGIGLNVRAFEFDIGADLRSQNAAQSWSGAGFGVSVGLKFGW